MMKKIINAIYSAFISIVLISIILASWTSYAFITQSSKSSDIANVIREMYVSQKSVFMDVIELSKILIKNSNESIVYEDNSLILETELTSEIEEIIQLDKSQINGDNALGIIIEPSSQKETVKASPMIVEDP